MLQKKFRLPANVRFRNAQTISSPFFVLKLTKNNVTVSRFGFLVSKKVDKRAVIRNRIKRQVRSVVESLIGKTIAGHDALFIIRQAALSQTTEKLGEEITALFIKYGLVTTQNTV